MFRDQASKDPEMLENAHEFHCRNVPIFSEILEPKCS